MSKTRRRENKYIIVGKEEEGKGGTEEKSGKE